MNMNAVPPDSIRAAKKRKITDRTLPASLGAEFEDAALYNQLLEIERKMDWTVTRKKVEMQEMLHKPITVTRKLRIFLSHSCSGQSWQASDDTPLPPNSLDFETGQGIPSWSFKVEGRLLPSTEPSRPIEQSPRKFSSFIKSLTVEMDRDPSLYGDANVVEWRRNPGLPDQDGFEIKRRGDMSIAARVVLHLEHTPERYKLAPQLSSILQLKEAPRVTVISALWNYIKINQLQDKVDRRVVKADAKLQAIFGLEAFQFGQLPEMVNSCLLPPDPVLLPYTIQVDPECPAAIQAYDIEIETEDTFLKGKFNTISTSMVSDSAKRITALDDQIAQAAQSIRNAKLKKEFMNALSANPQTFIQDWLASQSRDLDLVLGNEQGVREDDLKNSEFFRLPWIDEAVSIQEGLRVAGALNRLHEAGR
ncbi:SWI/SNF complex 60 kDa subunit [Sistotremastrum niveocremeum HHB9708]|uniref:SWI/SNF complex 60 kDa subunit n=2 Tax=Sistotremastraceae TaxID=3402574 RepID=A0A164XG58_9AGAM|nr:SWI/SNF complex 60 kDa subunit [Sistotremastrum niveocremeum HHB9708]KZT41332.1 SWI/SNF complex 60 kDa subunit [Sistotremastrum suecicum HHB10207 ss-3]